ncbi:MAG: amidase [Variovorax sp.]|nr:amidase [Variovorax sp.]
MRLHDALSATACEQAQGIARGLWRGSELIAAQRARIAQENPRLRAYVAQTEDDCAGEATGGALAGIGFAVKDNIALAGFPSHAGLRALNAAPEPADAPVVRRLKAAGLVALGKLNMSPMALGATNRNADFGDCENPRRAGFTPGGSSGGSGAAVAAGLCAIALGTDTMGSVRIPAAYCGVVGFKPSFGEISTDGVVPLCRLLDHVGILARSVDDVTQAFAFARTPGGPQDGAEPLPMHLAVPAKPGQLGLTDVVARAFERTLARLRSRGWTLREVDLSFHDFGAVRRAGLLLCEAELLGLLGPVLAQRANDVPADLRALLDYAGRKSATDLARALGVVIDAGVRLADLQREHEMLLLPTAPQTSFRFDAPVPAHQADLTALANFTGGPAISLPVPVGEGELPVGVQLVGVRAGDWRLLRQAARIARDIEEAT